MTHNDEVYYRAPFNAYRTSVLWKADVYNNEEERRRLEAEKLTHEDVARIFNDDLQAKGLELRVDAAKIDDPALAPALASVYPEPVPVDAGESIFDAYYKK